MATKRQCYIAGPMRGLPEYNYPTFMLAARMLRDAGWEVFNPAEMDMEEDQAIDYAEFTLKQQKLYDTAMNARRFARRDLDVILDVLRAECGDAVVVLPGYEDSIGATAETSVARWVFLPILKVYEAINVITRESRTT